MSTPIGIEAELVLAIHDRQLAEHGGGSGLRNEAAPHSALGCPMNQLVYEGDDVLELAAKYTAGTVQIHPLVDGNERTGFVVGILFLELNGFRFTASEESAAQATLALAAGAIDEKGFCEFLRANSKRSKALP